MDSIEYAKHLEYEKNFYNLDTYKDDLTEKANCALSYFLDKLQDKIKKQIGHTVWDYTITTINQKATELSPQPVRILSIGSGPGGTEMNIAKKISGNYIFECIDINEKMLALGQEKAESEGLNMKFIQQDINEISLTSETYDIVFAHASLHHMLHHEHICNEIKKSMKDNAEFIIFEVIPRNGLRMWDETREIANKLWFRLPFKYKYNSKSEDHIDHFETLPDRDLSVDGFECIRSEELYPILKQNFHTKIEVFGFSFARRFVESPFGNNYDLENNPFDMAILDTIIELDEHYTRINNLRPEQVFLVLEK